LAREAKTVWVSKGKKLLQFDLGQDVSDDALAKVMLGRSGTLRAPAIRVGDTFIVGYHLEGYTQLFG
jgi:hypothetical protein